MKVCLREQRQAKTDQSELRGPEDGGGDFLSATTKGGGLRDSDQRMRRSNIQPRKDEQKEQGNSVSPPSEFGNSFQSQKRERVERPFSWRKEVEDGQKSSVSRGKQG